MPMFTPAKKVTEDRRHILLYGGYASSGSEHDGLSSLSENFFFNDEHDYHFIDPKSEKDGNVNTDLTRSDDEDDGDNENGRCSSGTPSSLAMLRDLMNRPGDQFKADLAADVMEATARFEALRRNRSALRRAVMGYLRELGYDAGVCKSSWESSGGITAGSYEYIDVVRLPSGDRYIVDLEFAAEFEIARPTEEYEKVVRELPKVFVGKAEELKRAVRLLAEEVKRSLRARDMHVPPWRKPRYMHSKWLGPYKRTTNNAPATLKVAVVASPPGFGQGREVQCRALGFAPGRHVAAVVARIR